MTVNLVKCALLKKAAFTAYFFNESHYIAQNKLFECYVSGPNIVFQHHESFPTYSYAWAIVFVHIFE